MLMLQLSGMLLNRPVLSLRTGTQIATTMAPIINPNNLKIEGLYCLDERRKQSVLLAQDIRDILPQGVVVNDLDALSDPDELVRLKKTLDTNFQLVGKAVVTSAKQKLGKVSDYATETESMFVKKLYVTQSIFKNFSGGNLGIDRTQILEITDKHIVVNDLNAKVPARAAATA
jgi:sporulation protein YlmC with PRC-barrel domain